MPVTHPFVSAKAEGVDATLVGPNEWNANHSGHEDLPQLLAEPTVAQTVLAGCCANIIGLPLIIDSGVLVEIDAGGVLVITP